MTGRSAETKAAFDTLMKDEGLIEPLPESTPHRQVPVLCMTTLITRNVPYWDRAATHGCQCKGCKR